MWETYLDEPQRGPQIPLKVWIEPLPEGEAGTIQTLERMAQLVKRDAQTALARSWASDLKQGRTTKQFINECFIAARDFVRFKDDPQPFEMLQDFERLAESRAGDCDDKVLFLSTLLEAGGVKSRFVVQSYAGADWNHVFCEAQDDDGSWVALDPAADGHKGFVAPMGWRQSLPQNRSREAIFEF